MVKVKTTDPYGPGFFEDAPPTPEPAGPASAPPEPDTELSAAGIQAKVRLNADIDRDLHRRLRIRVASEGITIADFIRDVLQRELQ